MNEKDNKKIEVRGFLQLDAFLKKNHESYPLILDLEDSITGVELAEKLNISLDEIEVIFVNGLVQALDYTIYPGDRVAFLPPGCPGPYRIALGFYGKNQGNKANFKIKDRK